jgi:hypothetical protein
VKTARQAPETFIAQKHLTRTFPIY